MEEGEPGSRNVCFCRTLLLLFAVPCSSTFSFTNCLAPETRVCLPACLCMVTPCRGFVTSESGLHALSPLSCHVTEIIPPAPHLSQDGSILVGHEAEAAAHSDPANTFYGIKRLMGRTYRYDDVFGKSLVV